MGNPEGFGLFLGEAVGVSCNSAFNFGAGFFGEGLRCLSEGYDPLIRVIGGFYSGFVKERVEGVKDSPDRLERKLLGCWPCQTRPVALDRRRSGSPNRTKTKIGRHSSLLL